VLTLLPFLFGRGPEDTWGISLEIGPLPEGWDVDDAEGRLVGVLPFLVGRGPEDSWGISVEIGPLPEGWLGGVVRGEMGMLLIWRPESTWVISSEEETGPDLEGEGVARSPEDTWDVPSEEEIRAEPPGVWVG